MKGWRGLLFPLALIVIAQVAAMATHLQSFTLASPADAVRLKKLLGY